MLPGEPATLQVDIPHSPAKGQEAKASPLGGHSNPIQATSPTRSLPPKVEGQVSMTMEVSELLSQEALVTSGHASRSSTLKMLEPLVLVTPLPAKEEDFAKPVDTSSQVSTPDNAEMDDPTLEEIHAMPSPSVGTPWSSSGALP